MTRLTVSLLKLEVVRYFYVGVMYVDMNFGISTGVDMSLAASVVIGVESC